MRLKRSFRMMQTLALAGALAAPLGTFAQDKKETDGRRTPRPTPVAGASNETRLGGRTGQQTRNQGKAGQAGAASDNSKGSAADGQAARRPGGRTGTARATSGGKGTSASRSSGALSGSFKFTIDRDARVLRVAPMGAGADGLNMYVREGDQFWTAVRLESYRSTEFDEVRFVLDFPPEVLEPLAINDRYLAAEIQGDPVTRIDSKRGLVLYQAKLAKALPNPDGPIVAVQWRAKRPVTYTSVGFGSWGGQYASIASNGNDLIGGSEPQDGHLSMALTVLPKDEATIEEIEDAAAFDFGNFEHLGGVRLAAIPPAKPPHVGELFAIDLVLDNRSDSALDNVRLVLEFDPEVLTIVDADLDNAVTTGVNILDGPFRSRFPFEYHIQNAVYQSQGRIHYQMGTNSEALTRGRVGTFARVYAIAKKPTTGTYFRFGFAQIEGYPSTSVTYVGGDVLGDPTVAEDGALPAVFSVLNAPVSSAETAKGD